MAPSVFIDVRVAMVFFSPHAANWKYLQFWGGEGVSIRIFSFNKRGGHPPKLRNQKFQQSCQDPFQKVLSPMESPPRDKVP